MAEPLTQFQEPGFFSQIQESPSLALLPGSVRAVGLIGTGKPTRTVLQENLTRDDASKVEALANGAASITRAYSLSVFQYPISSYGVGMTGSVAEGAGYNVSGLTLIVSVGSGSAQTVTFTGTNPLTLAQVVTQINSGLSGAYAAADDSATHLRLASGSAILGDGGNELKIGAGTANTALGFTSGQVSNQINWTPSMASTDPNVRPQDTEAYLLDYERPVVAADLAPQSFFNLSQVIAVYGDPSNSNKVSLGAQGAFSGGASIVTIRQLDPNYVSLSSEMDAALSAMEPMDVNYLVPMSSDTSLWSKYLVHVSKMSSKLERMERRALLGVDETSARIPLTGVGTSWANLMATFVANSGLEPKRIQVLNPGYALVTVKNAQIVTDGCYNAAVLAGMMASPAVDTATPMTRKAMPSIDNLLQPDLLRSQKNYLTSIGVTVLELKGASVVVRRSITADSTSIASQEPSIVDSLDQVASETREALENRFEGTKIGKNTKAEVEAATTTFLDRFVADEIIGDFRNVVATQNSVEPRQFDITAEVLPIFPFLWGTLNLTIVIS